MTGTPQDTTRQTRAATIAEKALIMLGLVALARVVITLFFAPAGSAASAVLGIVLLMVLPLVAAYFVLRRDWPYARHAIAAVAGIFAVLGTSVALRVLLTIGKAPTAVIEAGHATLYVAEAMLTLASWVLLIVLCISLIATLVPGGGRE
ncbi:hypothetical protein M8756_15035 [Lutimaribacter sp. EGI FJ00015]|uniref:Uncharacterized protein n=1 Tax=Lutimaribacter degradans TaxID=2945989 RepID=A0ACC5ZYL3_9RHOB|nr:hypothetical protein [Lutimaribacter sp. EGI FJ00013]MCM2563453.1 hypothetical protein [Lutimaribacter sp. EGI FJ00013]MCO0614633.1 hypothetical protein [Lutimaribacter sp. EGI FJ00015]MCO0637304.1 hypothetical protein [Lutimaribacter sp. EGI FJ00014]